MNARKVIKRLRGVYDDANASWPWICENGREQWENYLRDIWPMEIVTEAAPVNMDVIRKGSLAAIKMTAILNLCMYGIWEEEYPVQEDNDDEEHPEWMDDPDDPRNRYWDFDAWVVRPSVLSQYLNLPEKELFDGIEELIKYDDTPERDKLKFEAVDLEGEILWVFWVRNCLLD